MIDAAVERNRAAMFRIHAGDYERARWPAPLTFLALLWAAACGDAGVEPAAPAPVPTAVAVNPGSAALTALGETARFTAEVRDQSGQVMAGAAVAWTSSDASVAAVDASGLVTAAANGSATITATAGSASGTAAVTVAQVVRSVAVSPSADTLVAFGDTVRLMAEAIDANGHAVAGSEFSWSSSDTMVVRVDDSGLVESLAEGAAVVTATASDVAGGADVRVVSPLPTTIAVSPDTVRFAALGQTAQLRAEVREQAGRVMAEAFVSWSSGDTLVAAADSAGMVTAVGGGTTMVTAAAGEASDAVVVTVMQSAGSVVVSPAESTVVMGDTLRLAAEAFDENGHRVEEAVFSWSSSDAGVARVDDMGFVEAVVEGTVEITAMADDATGTAEITVENPDRAALVALYEATNGPNWNDGTNWLTDAPLGEWYGVEVARAGRVVGLYLNDNNLSGVIPPELGNLEHLVALSLNRNNLPGAIPAELGSLANLRILGLEFNHLKGSIPPELGNLRKLSTLYLRRNNLTGSIPPELGNLDNLVTLDLGSNSLTGLVPSELGSLEHLQRLSVYRNGLKGGIPSELGNLRRLRSLWVMENAAMTGALPVSLSRLPLEDFRFGETGLCVPDDVSFRSWLNGIQVLEGTGLECTSVFRAPLEALYRSAGGSAWTASDNWLTDAPLSEWHGVQVDDDGQVVSLDLGSNNLNGSVPSQLGSLSRLKSLNLINNRALEGRLPLSLSNLSLENFDYSATSLCVQREASFRRWLDDIAAHNGTGLECEVFDRDVLEALYSATGGPRWNNRDQWLTDAPLGEWHGVSADDEGRVVGLSLSANNLSGSIPPVIGGLANLEDLWLSVNSLTGPIPAELAELSSLRSLSLRLNDLTGPIPAELRSLPVLEYLSLARNHLTGSIPAELGNLSALRWMYLYDNQLTGSIPAELGNLSLLEYLRLHGNDLAGPIPAELGNLSALQELLLYDNDLTGAIPAELGNLSALRWMHLFDNDLTGAIPAELGNLRALSQLQLQGNDLTGPIPLSLSRLSGLKLLAANNNAALSGAIPDELTGLRQLTGLHFDGTSVCAPRTRQFQEWLDGIPAARVLRCGTVDMPFYMTQAVQSLEFPVPLVAGRDALLRVFVAAEDAANHGIPRVRATFFQSGGTEPIHVADVAEQTHPIPAGIDEGNLSASANARIPGDLIVPGLEMVVEVDPDARLDPALGITRRIPASGRVSVDVRAVPRLDLTVVPLRKIGSEVSRSLEERVAELTVDHATFDLTRKLLPVGDFELSFREPLIVSNEPIARYCGSFLPIVEAARIADGALGTYAAIVTGGGIAIRGGNSVVSNLSSWTMAHELGHSLSLWHAPCGGALGTDPFYPHAGGATGAWGYDFNTGSLVPPSKRDIMGYCYYHTWISDYHFNKAMNHRLRASTAGTATPAVASAGKSLLLWGGADADGEPELHPAFVVDAPPALPRMDGPFRLVGHDENGRILFSMRFAMQEVADGDGGSMFVFAVPAQPEWAEALASVTLTGPNGSTSLSREGDTTATLLRDPATGRVRGILHDEADPSLAQMAATAGRLSLPDLDLDIQVSRGIPGAAAWRR